MTGSMLWSLSWIAYSTYITSGFSIDKVRIPGIWKLQVDEHVLPHGRLAIGRIRAQLLALYTGKDEIRAHNQEILVKLNPDGTFRQCSEGCREGCRMSGRWILKNNVDDDDAQLLLALDRQYYGPRHDTLLEGTLDDEVKCNRTVQGRVFTGKFKHPKQHPTFFDEPLTVKNATGVFTMEQAVATYSIFSSSSSGVTDHDTVSDEGPEPAGCFQLRKTAGDEYLILVDDDELEGLRSIFE